MKQLLFFIIILIFATSCAADFLQAIANAKNNPTSENNKIVKFWKDYADTLNKIMDEDVYSCPTKPISLNLNIDFLENYSNHNLNDYKKTISKYLEKVQFTINDYLK